MLIYNALNCFVIYLLTYIVDPSRFGPSLCLMVSFRLWRIAVDLHGAHRVCIRCPEHANVSHKARC